VRYSVVIKRAAERELDSLPGAVRRRIFEKLLTLEESPRPVGSKKLVGGSGYRLRIGDYRVLYEVNDPAHLVTVFAVGHRREVYR